MWIDPTLSIASPETSLLNSSIPSSASSEQLSSYSWILQSVLIRSSQVPSLRSFHYMMEKPYCPVLRCLIVYVESSENFRFNPSSCDGKVVAIHLVGAKGENVLWRGNWEVWRIYAESSLQLLLNMVENQEVSRSLSMIANMYLRERLPITFSSSIIHSSTSSIIIQQQSSSILSSKKYTSTTSYLLQYTQKPSTCNSSLSPLFSSPLSQLLYQQPQ